MKRKEIEGELCEKHQLLKQTDHIPLKLQEAQTYATSEQFEAMKERYKTVVLAHYIRELFEHPEQAEVMGRSAAAHAAQTHDPEKNMQDILKIYHSLT